MSSINRITPSLPIVAIGGSAGALPALKRILGDLPSSFPGVVLVVLHTPQGVSALPVALERHSNLPLWTPRDGEELKPGSVLVASTGSHLMVRGNQVHLHRGPRENRQRPAIDPLFRSVAKYHGPNVIAVLLSGLLDDGVPGLHRVRVSGGSIVVQSLEDALYPDLPRAALRHLEPDDVRPAAEIAALLVEAAKRHENSVASVDFTLAETQTDAASELPAVPPEEFTCPTCHGNLWLVREGEVDTYRCRIGHVFTAQHLHEAVNQEAEASLWVAVRSLEEAAEVSRRLHAKASAQGLTGAASLHERREQELRQHAQVLRDLIEGMTA